MTLIKENVFLYYHFKSVNTNKTKNKNINKIKIFFILELTGHNELRDKRTSTNNQYTVMKRDSLVCTARYNILTLSQDAQIGKTL